MKTIYRVLVSDAFIEKLMLFAITVVLTGVLIPYVFKSIERSRVEREALIAANTKLLDDFTEAIITAETLLLDVSWFGTAEAKNRDMQEKAYLRYSEKVPDILIRLRTQVARARTLASEDVATKVDAFTREFTMLQDLPAVKKWNTCIETCEWEQEHKANQAMLVKAQDLVLELARDLDLMRPEPNGPFSGSQLGIR